jgi:hypothetical protein
MARHWLYDSAAIVIGILFWPVLALAPLMREVIWAPDSTFALVRTRGLASMIAGAVIPFGIAVEFAMGWIGRLQLTWK